MGKPFKEALAEVDKCILAVCYYSEKAEDFLSPQPMASSFSKSYVSYEPLGVILGVMPWNFPYWQVIRFAVPTLLAGNTVLLKHAPNTFGCAELLEEVFIKAGLGDGLFTNLVMEVSGVKEVLADPRVAGVSLTGSTQAGKAVASLAGQHLKKSVLELGGSDPYVILDDADLDLAADKCVTSRLINGGQSCIAAKRWIVTSKNHATFRRRVLERLKASSWGDPFHKDVGPMARKDLRDQLHQQVQKSLDQGAELLLGGFLPEGSGYYYPVSLLDEVKPGMAAFDEELFGPVGVIVPAGDEQDALKLARSTRYGLGAAVFSRDQERAEKIAKDELEAGCCFVNDFVKSDPLLPFGGIKESGYGRELSFFGIHEFVNIKTVVVA